MIDALFNSCSMRAAGGAAKIAPPTVAHFLALEAVKSPFVFGGDVGAQDVAVAAWILSRKPGNVLAAVAEELRRQDQGKPMGPALRRVLDAYGREFWGGAWKADAEKLVEVVGGAFSFYRIAAKSGEGGEKTETVAVSPGVALVVRLMADFGYSRQDAVRERLDWAMALVQTDGALHGRVRIVTESQGELIDELAKVGPEEMARRFKSAATPQPEKTGTEG